MLKTSKKILATIMVVIMVLTAVPLSSFVGVELPAFDLGIRASAKTVASSGSCGDNVTYTYNSSTGELVISGTGPMRDYPYDSASPFYKSDIKSVVIEDGVTRIGSNVFISCYSLASITIPDSVTTIGYYAFYNCYNLTSVIIPDRATTIDMCAFCNCNSLASITIPDSVTVIGYGAFAQCGSLASVTIGDNVTTIGNNAFDGTAYYKNSSNWENDVLYNGKYLIKAKDSLLGSYTIKEGTKLIADSAFSPCPNLTDVVIPNGVTSIGNGAFSGCAYLETINIPDSVTFVGAEILKNTAWFNYRGKGLIVLDGWAYGYKGSDENVTITLDKTVKNIVDEAFVDCKNIVAFKVDSLNPYLMCENGVLFNKNKTKLIMYPGGKTGLGYLVPDSVKVICKKAFYNNKNLQNVTISDSVTTIDYSSFALCDNLTSIRIGKGIKAIDADAFYINTSIARSVYITDLEAWCKIDFANISANPLYNGRVSSNYRSKLYINNALVTTITIPETLTEIKAYTFSYCHNLSSVTISDSITTIGNSAFYNCGGFTCITIPDCVTVVGDETFGYCDNLTNVTLGKKLKIVGYGAFCNCSALKEVFHPGSQEDWDKLYIEDYNNGSLTNADLYLNHTHNYKVTIIASPTCTETGLALYECAYGDTKTEIVPALGHNEVIYQTEVEATCTKDGYTKGVICSVCGLIIEESKVISALPHTVDWTITKEATCTNEGEKTGYCTVCETNIVEIIPKTTHPDADCNKVCDVCFETITGTSIWCSLVGHQMSWVKVQEPTCTSYGREIYVCTRADCGYISSSSSLPRLSHTKTTYQSAVAPTCTEPGSTEGVECSVCHMIISAVQIIPALGHNWVDIGGSIEATCTTDGVDNYKCSNCGEEKKGTTPALDHDWEYLELTYETCVKDGYMLRACQREGCNAKEEKVTPATHDLEEWNVKSPTCTESGEKSVSCMDCTYSAVVVLPAKGHTYSEWVELLPATCSERGLNIKICNDCNDIQRQIIPKLAHIDADGNGVCDTCENTDTPDVPDTPDEPDTPNVPDTPNEPDVLEDPSANCSCNCHKGGLSKIIFNIILFFQKLLRSNKTCSCGASHY